MPQIPQPTLSPPSLRVAPVGDTPREIEGLIELATGEFNKRRLNRDRLAGNAEYDTAINDLFIEFERDEGDPGTAEARFSLRAEDIAKEISDSLDPDLRDLFAERAQGKFEPMRVDIRRQARIRVDNDSIAALDTLEAESVRTRASAPNALVADRARMDYRNESLFLAGSGVITPQDAGKRIRRADTKSSRAWAIGMLGSDAPELLRRLEDNDSEDLFVQNLDPVEAVRFFNAASAEVVRISEAAEKDSAAILKALEESNAKDMDLRFSLPPEEWPTSSELDALQPFLTKEDHKAYRNKLSGIGFTAPRNTARTEIERMIADPTNLDDSLRARLRSLNAAGILDDLDVDFYSTRIDRRGLVDEWTAQEKNIDKLLTAQPDDPWDVAQLRENRRRQAQAAFSDFQRENPNASRDEIRNEAQRVMRNFLDIDDIAVAPLPHPRFVRRAPESPEENALFAQKLIDMVAKGQISETDEREAGRLIKLWGQRFDEIEKLEERAR